MPAGSSPDKTSDDYIESFPDRMAASAVENPYAALQDRAARLEDLRGEDLRREQIGLPFDTTSPRPSAAPRVRVERSRNRSRRNPSGSNQSPNLVEPFERLTPDEIRERRESLHLGVTAIREANNYRE